MQTCQESYSCTCTAGSMSGCTCSRKPTVLCLHAFRTNAECLERQLNSWSNFGEAFAEDFELECINGFHECTRDEATKSEVSKLVAGPYYEWHNAKEVDHKVSYTYEEESLENVAEHLREDPNRVGLLGFSQGGQLAFTYVLLSLRDPIKYPPPRFVVLISCFASRHHPHASLIQEATNLPVPALVCYGAADDHVEPEWTRDLARRFATSDLTEVYVPRQTSHRIPQLNDVELSLCRAFAQSQARALPATDAMSALCNVVARLLSGNEQRPPSGAAPQQTADAGRPQEVRQEQVDVGIGFEELFKGVKLDHLLPLVSDGRHGSVNDWADELLSSGGRHSLLEHLKSEVGIEKLPDRQRILNSLSKVLRGLGRTVAPVSESSTVTVLV